jgi:hypothetical protein
MTNSLTPIVRDRGKTQSKKKKKLTDLLKQLSSQGRLRKLYIYIYIYIYISYYNIGYGWIMDGWGKTWQVKICTILFLSAIRLTIK